MSSTVIYEVARYSGPGEDATLLERVQLIAVEGVLRVRDSAGNETVCVGVDVGVEIGSTPALREIRARQEARITCGADIAAQMPFLLVPVSEGEDFSECSASVNGESCAAYPTVDSEYVLLPGWDPYEAPSMNPCWAEFRVGEGEWNPLTGDTSIGLVTPGVAVEYARYNHGGMGGSSAVAIRRFDDFTTLFVDWMVNNEVLVQLWGGDTAPPLTAVDLFSAAAAAADRQGGWDSEMDGDESESDEDEEASGRMYYGGNLELHLPDEIISQVGDRLTARGAHFAATLPRAFEEYDTLDEGWGTPEDHAAILRHIRSKPPGWDHWEDRPGLVGLGPDSHQEPPASETPVSPHYAPLEWDRDTDYLDGDDGIAAEGDDWRYTIYPVHGTDGEVIGYRVSGGDYESGAEFGSSLVGGKVGELTLAKAKAAAAADYASRYCEAEGFLDGLLDDWDDDDGPRTRRNDQGRIVCRVDEPGIEKVEVVATLEDYDRYYAGGRSVALSLRTILSYSYNGDRDALLDELRRLIRRDTRSGDS